MHHAAPDPGPGVAGFRGNHHGWAARPDRPWRPAGGGIPGPPGGHGNRPTRPRDNRAGQSGSVPRCPGALRNAAFDPGNGTMTGKTGDFDLATPERSALYLAVAKTVADAERENPGITATYGW